MCLAIPGKVVGIREDGDEQEVRVEYPGETRKAKNIGLDVKEGDYVIVQAQMIVQKVPEEEALESLKAWKESGRSCACNGS
ncbi:MAG: HypC/HybG/HupF family hydrogenase formation chaperone [Candidatus Woesearchaeota archaeon]